MDGQVLETTRAEKDIGVMVQDDLKPSLHALCQSGSQGQWGAGAAEQSCVVQRQQHLHEALQCLCQTHSGVLHPGLCLEKVQIRAVKMVSNIGGGNYDDRLVKLNMTTLEERR